MSYKRQKLIEKAKQESDERLGIVGNAGDKSDIVYSCDVGGKTYIGSTGLRFRERIWYHQYRARSGSNALIHKALRENDMKAVWKVIEEVVDEEKRLERENYFMVDMGTMKPNGWNEYPAVNTDKKENKKRIAYETELREKGMCVCRYCGEEKIRYDVNHKVKAGCICVDCYNDRLRVRMKAFYRKNAARLAEKRRQKRENAKNA